MILPDVNVLVYAYRKDVDDHPRFRLDNGFLKDLDNGYRLRPMIEGPTRGLGSTNGTDIP